VHTHLEHGAGIFGPAGARLWLFGGDIQWIQSRRAMGVMSDHNDELEISACVRGEFEACLEQEGI
jgi:hypothetical protein